MKKRLFAILLTAAILLGILPVTAGAVFDPADGYRMVKETYTGSYDDSGAPTHTSTGTFQYNSKGQLTQSAEKQNWFGGLVLITNYTYDSNGWLTKQETTCPNWPDGLGMAVMSYIYTYNSHGQKIHAKAYDVCSGFGDPYELTYTYDHAGNLIREDNEYGGINTYQYNSKGQQIQKIEQRGNRSLTTSYRYNSKGQLIEKKEPDSVTTYSYNNKGQQTGLREECNSAPLGPGSKQYKVRTETYTFDVAGNEIAYNCYHDGKIYESRTWEYERTPSTSNGWQQDGNTWYYYDNGKAATGWKQVDGTWYYMDSSGAMLTGWFNDNGTWYYMNGSGAMLTGWVNDNGTWYYMNGSGAMLTGWVNDNGTWYYMNNSGAMLTGWFNDNGTWYYMSGSGAMLTGWVNDNGTWYYMSGSGAMLTGWVNDNGTWYYMNDSGAMLTGWLNDNGTWYYLYDSGSMAIGWLNLDDTWYYLNTSGNMLTGTQNIDGTFYTFDTSGAWIG